MINRIFIAFLLVAGLLQVNAISSGSEKDRPGTVIVFVDETTAQKCEEGIAAYINALKKDGLTGILKSESWKNPEMIKNEIRQIYEQDRNLEGIILIGDIPIPMILDAQHLTSAFKIDQERFPKIRTGVPSDRFYDDFDLKFSFIEQDTTNSLLFYYSLAAESPQQIQSDIYSGRIKASPDDSNKYRRLNQYLLKTSHYKENPQLLDRGLIVTGHGYYSESISSWAGEILAVKEQLPNLYSSRGRMVNLYHEMEPEYKKQVINQLEIPGLDLTVFHAHGDDDMQYLSDLPHGESVTENIEAVKYYLRSKLRQAYDRGKDLEEVKADYQERFDVPADWFTGAFDDSVKAADSLLNYSLDIYIQDIRQMTPQSSVIIFDQCFNGAYIHSQYVAGEYLFGEGNTIAAIANSVNVIQDLWSVEFLGMLDAGVRIGEWYKLRNYLESHVLGDPTFRFLPSDIGYPRELFKNPDVSEKTLRRYVNHNHPLIRAYALYRLFQLKDLDVEDELIAAYQQDESFNVRLEALKCLASLRTSSFEEILKDAITDPYELIRRFSVKWMGDVGRYDYLPYLVDNLFKDPAKRVNSNSWDAITKIGSDSARALALQMYSGQFSLSRRDDLMERLRSKVSSDSNWLYQDLMGKIMDDTLSGKKRYSAIRTFRYYRFREAVPFLLNYVQDDSQPEFLRETAIEALGWYTFSLHRNRIKEVCESIIKNKKNSAQLVNEARKTVKRIEAGANAPVTP